MDSQLRQFLADLQLLIDRYSGVTVRAPDRQSSFDIIVDLVAAQFDIDHSELTRSNGGCRIRHVAQARFVCFHLMATLTNASPSSIARYFKADHGTVLHGMKRALDLIETDRRLAICVQMLEKEILSFINISTAANPAAALVARFNSAPVMVKES